jgi:Holliday junction resolvase-like predicted endonuclease
MRFIRNLPVAEFSQILLKSGIKAIDRAFKLGEIPLIQKSMFIMGKATALWIKDGTSEAEKALEEIDSDELKKLILKAMKFLKNFPRGFPD